MSWFIKIFSSQNTQSSTEETIIKFAKQKNETEEKTTTVNELQDCNEETQSAQDSTQESSCYSWSSVSQSLDICEEMRSWTDDETEEEP